MCARIADWLAVHLAAFVYRHAAPHVNYAITREDCVCVCVHVCLRVFVKTGEGVRRGDPDVTFILILLHHHI